MSCELCPNASCEKGSICRFTKPPMEVSLEFLLSQWQNQWTFNPEVRPIKVPRELCQEVSKFSQPICFRSHTKLASDNIYSLQEEIQKVLQSGFIPSVWSKSGVAPPNGTDILNPLRRAPLLKVGKICPIGSSSVCITTNFATATFFPMPSHSSFMTLTAIYVIIPDHLWDIRFLELAMLKKGHFRNMYVGSLEYTASQVWSEQIAGAIIVKRQMIPANPDLCGFPFKILSEPLGSIFVNPKCTNVHKEKALCILDGFARRKWIESPNFQVSGLAPEMDMAVRVGSAVMDLDYAWDAKYSNFLKEEESAFESIKKNFRKLS